MISETPQQLLWLLQRQGAVFSADRRDRFALWRDAAVLLGKDSFGAFVCLNPSTADETENDPTVRRCISFCDGWNLGGFVMLNAFTFRSTDPAELLAQKESDLDKTKADNLAWINRITSLASITVCAWGNHGKHLSRDEEVFSAISGSPQCLGVNANGTPIHPLYVPANTEPKGYHLP